MDISEAVGEMKKLMELIKSEGKIAIVTHTHADIDAVASAYVLKTVAKAITGVRIEIVFQDPPKESVYPFMEKFGVEKTDIESVEKNTSAYVVVDTNSYELAPRVEGKRVIGVIDHHNIKSKDIKCEIFISNPNRTSNTEWMYEILSKLYPLNKTLSKQTYERVLSAVAIGIVSDTARFKSIDEKTLEILDYAIKNGMLKYEEIREIAEPQIQLDKRIAILQSFKHIEFRIINGYLVVTAEAEEGESLVANMLSEIGDVVFVARWIGPEKTTRVSARASHHFPVPLDRIMMDVANRAGGKGGGHKKAAGLGVKEKHTNEVLEECIEATTDMLEEHSSLRVESGSVSGE